MTVIEHQPATVTPSTAPSWQRRPHVRPATPLSNRERQVLELVSHGYSNREVGKRLYLSEDSVKTFLRNAYRRLGVRDRAHATRRGFELGILTADEATS